MLKKKRKNFKSESKSDSNRISLFLTAVAKYSELIENSI